MKINITILLILIWVNVSAQEINIKKAWVGENLEYLQFNNQRVYIEVFGIYPQEKEYYITGDTLRIYDKYTISKDNFSKEHIKKFDFFVRKMTDTTLTLLALDSNSFEISGGKKIITYRARNLVKKPDIDFELIKFESTECWGKCPTLKLQINKEKKLMFIGGRYAVKEGFYNATISDSLFYSLIDILKQSELDKLKTWEQQVSDVPEYTLEIHYNGKINYLKSFFLPAVTKELIIYLLTISKYVELIDSKQPFDIKFTTQ